MSSTDDSGGTGYQGDIRDAWKDALAEIAELERRQNPSGAARHQAATALNTFRKTLRPHADDNALERPWSERGVDVIVDWVHGTTTVERECPGLTSATDFVEVPKSHAVRVQRFDAVFGELQRIAKELGFAATTKDQTPSEEATMDDLRGLLKARGQTEALENLPDGEATDIETPVTEDEA